MHQRPWNWLQRSGKAQKIEDSSQRKVTSNDEFPIENPGRSILPSQATVLFPTGYSSPESMKGTNPRCRKATPSRINFRIAFAIINSVVPLDASGSQRQRSTRYPGI